MAAKKTSTVKEKIMDTLLHYGPMDINQLCLNIESTPELIIGALQSILSHKEMIIAREKINNQIFTWVAHPKTSREKLTKITGEVNWSNKKSLLNLRKLRKQLSEYSYKENIEKHENKQLFIDKVIKKNLTVVTGNEGKAIQSMVVYKMMPDQTEPFSYLQCNESEQANSETSLNESFKLDEFQRISIEAVLEGNLVLVSAPTGTGKTLIAEKLARQLLQNKLRMIYTSPLKALSNQKFRDFIKMFGKENVGLVTGDISINGSALLLVMTTEIFRNKCFGEPEELDGVGYVVFDEIHYLDDQARGTAWEESIIFAPPHVKILGLSATVPNISELAGWIADVRKSSVIVVEEKQRIVPLEINWLTAEGTAVDKEEAQRTIEAYIMSHDNEREEYGGRRGQRR